MTPTASAARPPVPAPEPTHPCARCGAPVGPGTGLCERCNPLGLRDVSASQVHGTVFVAVAVAIVTLAVLARLAVSGIGPFLASLESIVPQAGGLALTLTVTNQGDAAGRTTCRITDPADRGGSPGAFMLSPAIQPGQTISFSQTVTGLGTTARDLVVECRSP
ncbi:MAG: hypothetical protein H0U58_04680 [Chloroflexi bacterium]|nr:hypothetical protein [Chloroflexota bacterium]